VGTDNLTIKKMSRKLFFRNEDSERCHERDYFISDMKDAGIKEMTVFKAKIMPTTDFFWCGAIDDACLNGEGTCGVSCDDYQPRNGKNGRCKFHTHCYEPSEPVIIKIK
jgi:hypothetical protein